MENTPRGLLVVAQAVLMAVMAVVFYADVVYSYSGATWAALAALALGGAAGDFFAEKAGILAVGVGMVAGTLAAIVATGASIVVSTVSFRNGSDLTSVPVFAIFATIGCFLMILTHLTNIVVESRVKTKQLEATEEARMVHERLKSLEKSGEIGPQGPRGASWTDEEADSDRDENDPPYEKAPWTDEEIESDIESSEPPSKPSSMRKSKMAFIAPRIESLGVSTVNLLKSTFGSLIPPPPSSPPDGSNRTMTSAGSEEPPPPPIEEREASVTKLRHSEVSKKTAYSADSTFLDSFRTDHTRRDFLENDDDQESKAAVMSSRTLATEPPLYRGNSLFVAKAPRHLQESDDSSAGSANTGDRGDDRIPILEVGPVVGSVDKPERTSFASGIPVKNASAGTPEEFELDESYPEERLSVNRHGVLAPKPPKRRRFVPSASAKGYEMYSWMLNRPRAEDLVPQKRSFCWWLTLIVVWSCFVVLVILSTVHITISTIEIMTFMPEERFINVEGHHIFVRCYGQGEPAVLFSHSMGGNSLDFIHIQQAVANVTRTCSYDLPGYGHSIEFSRVQEVLPIEAAIDADVLLEELGMKDVVVVGHGLAGLHLQALVSRLASASISQANIQAMVLVDALGTTTTENCEPPKTQNEAALSMNKFVQPLGLLRFGLQKMTPLGLQWLHKASRPRDVLQDLPDDVRDEYLAAITTNEHVVMFERQFKNLKPACQQVNDTTPSSYAFPIVHVVPESGIYSLFSTLERASDVVDLSSSPLSRVEIINGTGATHVAINHNPELASSTTNAILSLLESIRENAPSSDLDQL